MKRKFPFATLPSSIPINFAVTAWIKGTFSIEQLRAALAKIQQKYPFISARLVQTEDGVWGDTDGVPEFPIHEIEGDWADYLPDALNQLLDLAIGPMLRFVIARQDGFTALVLICHHALADGLSGVYILRDILYYLANPTHEVTPLADAPLLDDLLPPVDLAQMDFSRPLRAAPHLYGSGAADRSQLYVLHAALTVDQTSALVARCRSEHTTVHAALCTAFLRAAERLEEGDHSPIHQVSSPVNLRSRFDPPIGEQFGLYICSGILTDLDCSAGRDFWEMAREVKASLQRESTDEAIFKRLHFFRQLYSSAHQPQPTSQTAFVRPAAPYDLSITNLGALNFPVEYGPLHLEAIYGPVVNPLGNEKVLGVATAAGCLTFSLSAPYILMDRPVGERLLRLGQDELMAAIE